jgi:hypothetical protein
MRGFSLRINRVDAEILPCGDDADFLRKIDADARTGK